MIQVMGLPEIVRPEEVLDVQKVTMIIMQEREKRLSLTKELIFQKRKNAQLEKFIEDLEENLGNPQESKIIEEKIEDKPKIGAYSALMRRMKINKYKLKLKKHRKQVAITREYKGRSKAAKNKLRVNGKFAKKSELLV
ncbi:hypothetical protein SteCoe_20613 [Stentor coeruleus]|uniref:CCT domain-containing protein n=1 Tax=Stentor coeruleus TaxID=5963 RepID=A0A1R2BRC2_9CILI|nr:hypothetical protein SteCoe_20613 [Stentor coeruleus]